MTRFRHVPWSSLRREQVYTWLHWSIFNAAYTTYDAIDHSSRTILDEALNLIETRSGVSIPNGSAPEIKPLLLTLDPVNVCLRPLTWYVVVKVCNIVLKAWYDKFYNLKHGSYNGLEYG